MRQCTLVLPIKDDDVLLGMKKRGFGKGKWNGFGGKVQEETIEQAAIRELEEECGLVAREEDLKKVIETDFTFPHKPDWNQKVAVFFLEQWKGSPMETEEMRPKWFKKNEIPLEKMWADDVYWLPQVLEGKTGKASFVLTEDEKVKEKSINLL